MQDIIERYEYKYLLPERLVPAVRDAALATSHLDRYADPDGTYRIRSLYFDTSDYDLYWANQREQADRMKLRVRTYPGKTSPVFLEVKRRVLDVIIKTRAAVPTTSWQRLLELDEAAFAELSPAARAGAKQFCLQVALHHLEPVLLVEYEREAYVSDVDSYARLTFDRRICSQPRDHLDLEADPARWHPVDHVVQTITPEPVCVLELKFERRPPAWMSALARRLDLQRHSFSKYCYGLVQEHTRPELRVAHRG